MALKTPRRFEFARDTFAFANELLWEYRLASGKMSFSGVNRNPTTPTVALC